jgi:hypothetical protein
MVFTSYGVYIICNIPAAPAYGVYISQLIRYARATNENDFVSNENNFLTSGEEITSPKS